MSETGSWDSWGDTYRRWGSIVAELTPEALDDFVRGVVQEAGDVATYSLLLALKVRFDCPDIAFDLLDEIHDLRDRKASPADVAAWGKRARSLLRQWIGDEPKSDELLRPPSSNAIH